MRQQEFIKAYVDWTASRYSYWDALQVHGDKITEFEDETRLSISRWMCDTVGVVGPYETAETIIETIFTTARALYLDVRPRARQLLQDVLTPAEWAEYENRRTVTIRQMGGLGGYDTPELRDTTFAIYPGAVLHWFRADLAPGESETACIQVLSRDGYIPIEDQVTAIALGLKYNFAMIAETANWRRVMGWRLVPWRPLPS